MRYEVAVSLSNGHIVHLNGPYPCGHWSDLRIYRHLLKNLLAPGEMTIADKGYRGEETCITAYDAIEPQVLYLMSVARARHETINGMFKRFRALRDIYRHDRLKHVYVFKTVAILTQLKLLSGRGSFQIAEFRLPASTEVNIPVLDRRRCILQQHFGPNVEFVDLANDGDVVAVAEPPIEVVHDDAVHVITQTQENGGGENNDEEEEEEEEDDDDDDG